MILKGRTPRRLHDVKIRPLKYKPKGYELLLPQVEHNNATESSREKLDDNSIGGQPRKVDPGKLDDSLPRFGPIYGRDQKSMIDTKRRAWQHVKKNSPKEDSGKTKEVYVATITRVEQKARETYGAPISCMSSEFRLMMIRDGCFFLQLALLVLGKSDELWYSDNDPFFSRVHNRRDIKKWMESIFFVGNQIPIVVLEELKKEKFFRSVIEKVKWDSPPSGLGKRVLYDLFLTHIYRNHLSIDVLFTLRMQVLGPDPRIDEFLNEDELDLEANEEEIGMLNQERTNFHGDGGYSSTSGVGHFRTFLGSIGSRNVAEDRRSVFPSATEMKKSGIRIKKLKTGGTRSIRFENYYFMAFLYLPVLPVDSDTEIIFRNLRAYETSQERESNFRPEVSSYLKFMSYVIQTPQDVQILKQKGIITIDKNSFDFADKLPEFLERLSSGGIKLTEEFRNLKREIRDYSSPLIRYQGIINFVVFLTFLQTFFAVLAYFKPPKQ